VTDFYTATADDLTALKWLRWDEDSGLYLCPAAQFGSLPDGIALWSISGDVKVKGRDHIDDDTRYGMLAYGIIPGRTRTDRTAEEVARVEAVRRAEVNATLAAACAENGLYNLATGEVLHGEAAADAILDMHPNGRA
jgi:hypothetical protein